MNTAEDLAIRLLAKSNPVLGKLSQSALGELLNRSEFITLAADQDLVRQGDPSDAAYLIVDGKLDVQVETAYGSVQLARISGGALVGEIGVFAELPRTATVRTCGPVRALKFDRTHLLRAGDADPILFRSVITALGRQMANFNHAIGFYTNALSALERHDFDVQILEELRNPVPELVNFSHGFRRLAEQIVLRRTQQEEMASAAAIQRAMLPSTLPTDRDNRFDIYAEMQPARDVGGDLYDVLALDPERLVITIGDISGKGVPASLFMAVTQTVMRLVVRAGHDLRTEIEQANDLLVASNKEMMFATLFCGVLDTSSGVLTYCNCGHNPPLVIRKAGAETESLHAAGPPLAIQQGIEYKAQSVTLSPGDMLFLYTDGVTETEDPLGEQFGVDRLTEAVIEFRDQPARQLVQHVIHRVTEFSQQAPQFDDITCVAVKRAEN